MRQHADLLTTVKRRKVQWYGHVSCSSGLAKTILQGTVKGGRRQGRQRKKWEDNIREWTGQEFGKSQREVENREKWRKVVAKLYVVPQRPSWLKDEMRAVFSREKIRKTPTIKYKGQPLEAVFDFQYRGLCFLYNNKFNVAQKCLYHKASRAMFGLKTTTVKK